MTSDEATVPTCSANLSPPRSDPCAALIGTFAAASPETWTLPVHDRVVVALFAVDEWRPWLAPAAALIDAAEAARVHRRRRPADRELLTLAYGLHRLLLGEVLACDPRDVPLHRDARGRPCVADRAIHTSLSHADGMIALAVTSAGVVGIDVEPRRQEAVLDELAARICHTSESDPVARLPAPSRGRALLGLWVRKEAALKAAGVGLAIEMNTFAASEGAAIGLPELAPHSIQTHMLDAGDDWVAAIASPEAAVVDCRWLRPGVRGGQRDERAR